MKKIKSPWFFFPKSLYEQCNWSISFQLRFFTSKFSTELLLTMTCNFVFLSLKGNFSFCHHYLFLIFYFYYCWRRNAKKDLELLGNSTSIRLFMCRSNSTSVNTVARSSALRAASNLTSSITLVSSEPERQGKTV